MYTFYLWLLIKVYNSIHSALGTELLITGLDTAGTFMTFQGTVSGVTVKDEVWVTGSDLRADRVTGKDI